MKTFHAVYRVYGNVLFAQRITCIAVAEDETVALGLILNRYPNSWAHEWFLQEIMPDDRQVFETSNSDDEI